MALHVGAPAHVSHAVRGALSNTYRDRWISSGGPTAWPPRSTPDLNPLGTHKHPCVCSSCWQWTVTSPSHCGCLSDYPQLPRHMFICTFLVLVWGSRAKNLSAHFSKTSWYKCNGKLTRVDKCGEACWKFTGKWRGASFTGLAHDRCNNR
jgi:hypothetical protein